MTVPGGRRSALRGTPEEGAAAVEMAILSITVFPLLFAIILPLSFVYGQKLAVERNAGQAARWGSLVTNGARAGVDDKVRGRATQKEITTYAQNSCGIDPTGNANITCRYSNDTVTVSCTSVTGAGGPLAETGKAAIGCAVAPAWPDRSKPPPDFSWTCASQVSLTVTDAHTTDYGPTGFLLSKVGLTHNDVVITGTSTVCKE